MDRTIEYYDQHAAEFEQDTAGIDLEHLYQPFLELVPSGGRILDAGCGPGRDSRVFLDRGYDVVSFDGAVRMVELATARTGQDALLLRFEDVEFSGHFHGVWACASLIHVPLAELTPVLRRLLISLKPLGVLYASFKYGISERTKGGRAFTDMTEERLDEVIRTIGLGELLKVWRTNDARPSRSADVWLNALVRRHDSDVSFPS